MPNAIEIHNLTVPQDKSNFAIGSKGVADITCTSCRACCCRLEVLLFSDTGVPKNHIAYDKWGSETMKRLQDGWCSALDRETYMCTIYENRPLVCREFEMGSDECITERKVQASL